MVLISSTKKDRKSTSLLHLSSIPPIPSCNSCSDLGCKNCKCQIIFYHVPELPYGWEKVEDPHYGSYYIDHVNKRTQYENPVIQARKDYDSNLGDPPSYASDVNASNTFPRKKKGPETAKRSTSDSNMNGRSTPSVNNDSKSDWLFTKNPDELKGEKIRTTIEKSVRGFGFTIIGGNLRDEEFLQIKNVVENGPAYNDGVLQTGDVLVHVNSLCVLGYTHQDVVGLFQTIPAGDRVTLEICHGYVLPFDPSDPDTKIVTTVAVSLPQQLDTTTNTPSYSGSSDMSTTNNMEWRNVSQRNLKSLPDLTHSTSGSGLQQNSSFIKDSNLNGERVVNSTDPPDVLGLAANSNKPEIYTINVVRGEMGFGFTIADSAYGQKVKQILDKPRCKTLLEGDILVEINGNNVRDMSHSQVVQVLKECQRGCDTSIVIQRGGVLAANKNKKPVKPPKPSVDTKSQQASDSSFTASPGAYFFSPGDSQHSPNMSDKLDDSIVSNKVAPSSESPENEPTNVNEDDKANDNSPGDNARTPTGEPLARPKTPTSTEQQRIKPASGEGRPKTPTRTTSLAIDRNRIPGGSRLPPNDAQNSKYRDDSNYGRKEFACNNSFREPQRSQDVNNTHNISGNHEYNARPPPGPRHDHHNRQDYSPRPEHRQVPQRQDVYQHQRRNQPMHNYFVDRREFNKYGDMDRSEPVNPTQFRSRTPGPELMGRPGPDYRHDVRRPKTPTAQDMRIKTPVQGYAQNADGNSMDYHNSKQQYPTGSTMGPDRPGYNRNNWQANRPDLSSPQASPGMRRADGSFENQGYSMQDRYPGNSNIDYSRGQNVTQNSFGGAGRPTKQSTSFENEDPSPSNITRVSKQLLPSQNSLSNHVHGNQSPRSPSRFSDNDDSGQFIEMNVALRKQENGFGFRIIGGTEEGSQVSVGHIVPGGAADVDGRLQMEDEIIYVDNVSVMNFSHHKVVQMMSQSSLSGRVSLGIRRRIGGPTDPLYRGNGLGDSPYPYDVTVKRRENEGFGFVIISSVTKSGSTLDRGDEDVFDNEYSTNRIKLPRIGRILENSPAERCNRLHVGDRILRVNGVDILHLHHEDIVNLIKDSGYSVILTIGPPQDDASSTASTSQRSSQGSMINAMAYPAISESDLSRRSEYSPYHMPADRFKHHPAERPKDVGRPRIPNLQNHDEDEYYAVELHRGARGFGFSIRGGREFNSMPLYVLRIAEGGAANMDGRLRVGDQLLEINSCPTENMTHAEAIDIIQNGGSTVKIFVKRTGKLPPSFDATPSPPARLQHNVANGPIGHSSPHVGRRNVERDEYFHNYPNSRSYQNY